MSNRGQEEEKQGCLVYSTSLEYKLSVASTVFLVVLVEMFRRREADGL